VLSLSYDVLSFFVLFDAACIFRLAHCILFFDFLSLLELIMVARW
jgi:hypothetical protein